MPCPVTTPSAGVFSGRSTSLPRIDCWWASRPNSTKVSGSKRRSIRLRAVSLPRSCCLATFSGPPMARFRRFLSRSSPTFCSNSPAASVEVSGPSADIARILTLVLYIVLELCSGRLIESMTDFEQPTDSTCPFDGRHPGGGDPLRLLGVVDLGQHREAQSGLRAGQRAGRRRLQPE